MSREKKLAVVALALGALAIFGDPYQGQVVRMDTRELASIVQGEVDHVTADELAEWILQGRADYRLIDLRDETSYAAYHIPTAEHVPIAQLPDYPLLRNEKIVLYSGGGIHSAQAWFLLEAQGHKAVYMLLGGLDAWMDEVLFPVAPGTGATPEQLAEQDRLAHRAERFGGSLREASGAEGAPALQLPEVGLPAVAPPATVPAAPQGKKKRREGC